MKAILWDGRNKFYGYLIFTLRRLQFRLQDFEATELFFDLEYTAINDFNYYHLYGLDVAGIVIQSSAHKKNIFLVDEPTHLFEELMKRVQLVHHNN